ncbi:hypothetical protein BC826DRAFT_923053, partial [Russula brevipes]
GSCLLLGVVYSWELFTPGSCLLLGVVYSWELFTPGSCLLLGVVYSWAGLCTSLSRVFVYFGHSPSLCDRNEPLSMKNGEELTELYLHQFSTNLDA